jgi:hypothetical protein
MKSLARCLLPLFVGGLIGHIFLFGCGLFKTSERADSSTNKQTPMRHSNLQQVYVDAPPTTVKIVGRKATIQVSGHLGNTRGATVPLIFENAQVGVALRTRPNVKPVFVSPGHLIDPDSAVKVVLRCLSKFRVPEPLRRAHMLVNEFRRERKNEDKLARPIFLPGSLILKIACENVHFFVFSKNRDWDESITEAMMSTTVRLRRERTLISDSKKRAARLIRELSEEKIRVAVPFLEFLKFLEKNDNGKEVDLNASIKQGVVELAQLKAGKLKPKSFEALLDEL